MEAPSSWTDESKDLTRGQTDKTNGELEGRMADLFSGMSLRRFTSHHAVTTDTLAQVFGTGLVSESLEEVLNSL